MKAESNETTREPGIASGACCGHSHGHATGISRRGLLGGIGGAAAVGGLAMIAASRAQAAETGQSTGSGLPAGVSLKVKPALMYSFPQRREKTSWRPYGGILTKEDLAAEVKRVEQDLARISSTA